LKLRESGDFLKAWGGIAGLQFGLPVIWTEMKKRGLTLSDLSRLMSERTSAFLGLESKKGSLTTGADADFVVFDADIPDTIRREQVLHRHQITPYTEMKVLGKVLKTYLRGQLIAADGKPVGDKPLGTELTRTLL
jgi:allantoinase